MKVIGVFLNVLAGLWAAFGVLVMLISTPGYTATENFIYSCIIFFIPSAIVIALGSLMIRSANRRRLRNREYYEREYDGLQRGRTINDDTRPNSDKQQVYRGRPSESGFGPPSQQQGPGSDLRGRTSGGSAYDAQNNAAYDVRYESNPSRRRRPAPLVEAVCRSCGARRTLRAGTSAECDYCGSTITAE
ncbi:hypothetical protein QWJ34_13445 [Saccharibacillus sp. CPCC 101409]|uniref:hypothetical protein n=1 Tax=Saccharibacillus sp. CPCC 101409 TaxID=3058041 RepID=UPI0026731604|nr:hypothetical protein [Saccharibacillus sp. CPCC 101409]MDO3410771.1 hypothetical protein [Saccharibacillus sp. CPCC 101409]